MSRDKKSVPASVRADVGTRAEPCDNTISVSQSARDGKPPLSYYAVIPASILHDPQLCDSAKLLYGTISALTRAEGYCWATNAYLGTLHHLSADRVGRLIAQLELRGYLSRETVRNPETNEVTGRKIWLILRTERDTTPPGKNNDTSRQDYRTPPGENNVQINILDNNNISPYSPPEGDGPAGRKKAEVKDVLFATFWEAYPARAGRKNGKADARKVWGKLKITAKLYDAIMDGLEAYLHSEDVQRGYAMDAARWLRGRHWEDEVLTALNPDTPEDGLLPGERMEDYICPDPMY